VEDFSLLNRLKNKYALKTIQYSDVKHLFETTEKERHNLLDKILKECDIQVTYPFFKYALTMNKDDIIFLLRQTQKHKIEVVKKDYKERSEIAKQLGITPNKLHSLMQVLG
jgi:NADH:ubiquinone oxidoreductase subunit E